MRLIQRTPAGLDVELGRWWLTAASVVCVCVQVAAVIAIVGGASYGVIATTGAGIAVSLAVMLLQLAILRHAYRRTVDFVPPL